ncbi:monooxygenase [Nannocystis radixulma]|uniref:Monooxygenase n=1 Tax=Nannocystis radixulma TaxID=2995305 RepID=A0ABT5B596_9BACT|nr:monooxygenase [Nannocystis radixulma]MDC0668845.1 monooxygenase [Nannocystis radixulma]
MQRLTAIFPLGLLLVACVDASGDSASTTDADDTSAGTSTGADAPEVTYWRDIKTVLDAKCVGCHSPGNLAPFSLESYADASAVASALPGSIMAGTMPPWPPDAACGTYLHDRSLAEADQETLLKWVELGAPEGDPADAPPAPPAPEEIEFDIELALPEPYTPTIAPDEYRCFLLPWPEDQETFITALSVTPGERQIVHHVIAFAIPPDQVADYQALDDADADPGYLCYGGPGGQQSGGRVPWIGAWVPGGDPGDMPEGTGIKVQPGSLVAVQMHYHTYPGARPDQSRIQIRTAASVDKVAAMMPFTNPAWVQGSEPMLIPAGEPRVVHNFAADVSNYLPLLFPDGDFQAGDSFMVHAAALHMHTRGVRGSLGLTGGQSTCLLDIPRWDFNWQGSYQLTQPVTVRPGDELRIECEWDNTAANQPVENGVLQQPRDILWGEGTGDEMCLGILYVTGV